MATQPIRIRAIFTGRPQTLTDAQGEWESSIHRSPVTGPVALEIDGLDGDEVTNKEHHGWPNMAVCCHTQADYDFWRERHGISLSAGAVGENWTLDHASEDDICLLDTYAVGTARIRVSKPRTPCSKQARKIGRSDWVRMVLEELRTGFYLQTLEPGLVQAGDTWNLLERPHPDIPLRAMNSCVHQRYDFALARRLESIPDVDAHWREMISKARARAVR